MTTSGGSRQQKRILSRRRRPGSGIQASAGRRAQPEVSAERSLLLPVGGGRLLAPSCPPGAHLSPRPTGAVPPCVTSLFLSPERTALKLLSTQDNPKISTLITSAKKGPIPDTVTSVVLSGHILLGGHNLTRYRASTGQPEAYLGASPEPQTHCPPTCKRPEPHPQAP